MSGIKKCIDPDEIAATYTVMSQLRPILKAEEYVALVQSMQHSEKYQLVGYFNAAGACIGAAGYRLQRKLVRKGISELYVDDLVTDQNQRSRGMGRQLLDWLKAESKAQGCAGIVLDSGLQRTDAHRFYKREGMEVTALHFYGKSE